MQLKTGKTVDRSVLAVVAVVLAGNERKVPAGLAKYFDHHSWQALLLILIAGVVGAFSPFESLARRGQLERRVRLQRELLVKLGALVEKAAFVEPKVASSDPGLHIWRPKRSLRHPSGQLERVGWFRLGHTPTVVGFDPKRGSGVVGLCWRDNLPKEVDVEPLVTQFNTEAKFNAQLAQDPDVLMNLSWEQFNRVSHRGAVFAAPIRDARGRFLGCVSVDVSHGFAQLRRNGVPALAASVASMFGREELALL